MAATVTVNPPVTKDVKAETPDDITFPAIAEERLVFALAPRIREWKRAGKPWKR